MSAPRPSGVAPSPGALRGLGSSVPGGPVTAPAGLRPVPVESREVSGSSEAWSIRSTRSRKSVSWARALRRKATRVDGAAIRARAKNDSGSASRTSSLIVGSPGSWRLGRRRIRPTIGPGARPAGPTRIEPYRTDPLTIAMDRLDASFHRFDPRSGRGQCPGVGRSRPAQRDGRDGGDVGRRSGGEATGPGDLPGPVPRSVSSTARRGSYWSSCATDWRRTNSARRHRHRRSACWRWPSSCRGR